MTSPPPPNRSPHPAGMTTTTLTTASKTTTPMTTTPTTTPTTTRRTRTRTTTTDGRRSRSADFWRVGSLRGRVVGSIALLSALGLFGAGTAALLVVNRQIDARIHDSLAQEIDEFSALARDGVDPSTGRPFSDAGTLVTLAMQRNVPDEHETHMAFMPDTTIVPVDGGGDLHRDPGFRAEATRHAEAAFGQYRSVGEGTVLYAVMPVNHEDGRAHFAVAYYADRERAELAATMQAYAVAAVTACVILILATWGLTRRILRPVEDLRSTADSITESDLALRIPVRGNDELAELGHTVNRMLDRLDDALRSQRRMLDDAGHELRTPITVLRGHLELMDAHNPEDVGETRELLLEELDRMSGLVGDLIVLAKSQRPDFLRLERVDLAELLSRTLAKAGSLGQRQWVVDDAAPLPAVVDPARLTQALLQLAANAVTATKPGDTIAFGCARVAPWNRIWVADSGPGIPAADRDRVFDRFVSGQRMGTSRGSGLGLSIVQAIASAHGGRAWAASSARHGGALLVLDLPAYPNPGLRDDGAR